MTIGPGANPVDANARLIQSMLRRIASLELAAATTPPHFSTVDWTPTLTASSTNPTMGSGSSAAGSYTGGASGEYVEGHGRILFGTSGVNAGSGVYIVSLPVDALSGSRGQVATSAGGSGSVIGVFMLRDNSGTVGAGGFLQLRSATSCQMLLSDGWVTTAHGTPWTWAASDVIHYQFRYLAA